ncbi:hypothetical protein BpHYR1_024674, partial [Brachionus plicatilis]
MKTPALYHCFANFDHHVQRCRLEQRLLGCGALVNRSFYSKCEPNKSYYRKECVKKMTEVVLMLALALIGSVFIFAIVVPLSLKPCKENLEILYICELLFEFFSCLFLFFPSLVRVSDNYFGEIYNEMTCELDYRSSTYRLNNIRVYLIDFFIYTAITAANVSNVCVVFYSFISVFRPLVFRKFLRIKISLPMLVMSVSLFALVFNLDHFMVCCFFSCVEIRLLGKKMRFVMLIKNSMLFVLVVCDLVLNAFLVHFLFTKSRQQKRLPVTPKKYLKKYEEMFVKP